jgi:hypothetical protein
MAPKDWTGQKEGTVMNMNMTSDLPTGRNQDYTRVDLLYTHACSSVYMHEQQRPDGMCVFDMDVRAPESSQW